VDERIADKMAVHAYGGNGPFVGARLRMKPALLLLSAVLLSMSACDHPNRQQVQRAATLTGGGDARLGRTDIRKYGCNTCHEISGVAGARGLIGPRLDGLSQRYY